MAVDIAYDPSQRIAVMYCNTEGRAFGPVFDDPQAAEDFLDWLRENPPHWAVAVAFYGDGKDPRNYTRDDLKRVVDHWRSLQTYVGDEPDGTRYLGGGNYGATSR